MFCAIHSIPHEDCPACHETVSAMRPTVFAELAAAELRSGTECCPSCEFVYFEAVDSCPQCAAPHPLHHEHGEDAVPALNAWERWDPPVTDLSALTLCDLDRVRVR